jgi:circadian clock protein KaiC
VELDALIGSGIEEGTSTLIVGSAGTGKSTLAAKFAATAAERGERAALYLFDESPQTLLSRCGELGIGLERPVEEGSVTLQQVDPAELTPGELTHSIKGAVDAGAKIVVIDSLNGYLNAMPGERFLAIQLHELLAYLGQRGVATILIGAHHGLIGTQMTTPVDASYLADAVIMLRYFEARGEVRQAISVMKKRGSKHERTVREFKLDAGGIRVGEALRQFRGVLTGVPTYEGDSAPLLEQKR